MLAKFNDAKVFLTGYAFVAPAVEQRYQVRAAGARRRIRRGIGQRDFCLLYTSDAADE